MSYHSKLKNAIFIAEKYNYSISKVGTKLIHFYANRDTRLSEYEIYVHCPNFRLDEDLTEDKFKKSIDEFNISINKINA